MRLKDTRTLQERAADLEKVYTFSIVATAKKHYGTIDTLKAVYKKIVDGKAAAKEQVDFCRLFSHKPAEYHKILGFLDGKRVKLSDVEPLFSKWLHYQHHFNKNYKSGKTYVVHGYWYIDFDVLQKFWNSKDVALASSSYYTQRQHKLIDKIILKGKTDKKHAASVDVPEEAVQQEAAQQEATQQEAVQPEATQQEAALADLNIVASSDGTLYQPTEELKAIQARSIAQHADDFAKNREAAIAEHQAAKKEFAENVADEDLADLFDGVLVA